MVPEHSTQPCCMDGAWIEICGCLGTCPSIVSQAEGLDGVPVLGRSMCGAAQLCGGWWHWMHSAGHVSVLCLMGKAWVAASQL